MARKKTVRYIARITETYHARVAVDVPKGEDPEEYVAELCNGGEIDVTDYSAGDLEFSREIETEVDE